MSRIAALVIAGLAAFASVACGPPKTSLTQVWQGETPRTPFASMLVFGVRMDEASRRTLEDTFVADLATRGVNAAPSYTMFPGELPPIDQARKLVNEAHYESVLVLKLRGVRDDARYVPGNTSFWGGYYGAWNYTNGSPGYVVTDETVVFETTLWNLRSEDKMVWTARTETLNPANGRDFAISLKRAVDPALSKNGFIGALPPKN